MGFSFSLLVLSETFLAFHKKTSVSLWKTHIHSNILMKIVCLKTSNYLNTFEHWPKNLWSLLQNFSTGLRPLHSTFNLEFSHNFFYPENYQKFFEQFWTLSEEYLAFWRKFIGLVVKTTFYVCIKTLQRWIPFP